VKVESSSEQKKPVEMPDSTSREREWGRRPFQEDEDILVQGQDGLLYCGVVVEVEVDLGQCLVRCTMLTSFYISFFVVAFVFYGVKKYLLVCFAVV